MARKGGEAALSRAPAGIHGAFELSPSRPGHTVRTRRTEVKTRHGSAVLIHARKARSWKRKRMKRMHTTQTTSKCVSCCSSCCSIKSSSRRRKDAISRSITTSSVTASQSRKDCTNDRWCERRSRRFSPWLKMACRTCACFVCGCVNALQGGCEGGCTRVCADAYAICACGCVCEWDSDRQNCTPDTYLNLCTCACGRHAG